MPTQTERLTAHASHLLDAFIQLRERYAILEPLLFDKDVVGRWGQRRKYRGFIILKNSLFLSTVQEIAKLCLDDDERAPSILNLMSALSDPAVLEGLREPFIVWKFPTTDGEQLSPEEIEALKRMELREQDERGQQFDSLYVEAVASWAELATRPALNAFRTARDRVTAHTEVRWHIDKYVRVDIGDLGIVWGDLRTCIDSMQRLVEIIGLIIRNTSFAWDLLDDQLARASREFWGEVQD